MNLLDKPSVVLCQGRHFNAEIIPLCVRWYVTDKLSYRDLVAIMAERNMDVAHTTILRWVQSYVPEFEKRCHRWWCYGSGFHDLHWQPKLVAVDEEPDHNIVHLDGF